MPPKPDICDIRHEAGPRLVVGRPRRCGWVTATLPVPVGGGWPAGRRLRVIHLSDLHVPPHPARVPAVLDVVADRLRDDPPDLVLFTGDLSDDKLDPGPALPAAADALAGLASRAGVFAVLGNHDGDLVAPRLVAAGVTDLTNRTSRPLADLPVELVGLTGVHRSDDNLATRLDFRADYLRVVLSHYPDSLRRVAHLRPALLLAGHTHGGQICLPGGRPVITHDSLPRTMAKGIHPTPWGGWLSVSPGLGVTKIPLRLFCPPAVIDLTLLPQGQPAGDADDSGAEARGG